MKKSSHKFSLLTPKIIENEDAVRAWFTLKNEDLFSDDSRIAGLNLGLNTDENKEIVKRNRSELFEHLNLDPKWIAFGEQVHGTRIQKVMQGETYSETDGLITRVPGLALAIQVADCAAVIIWDSENRVIGAFHAGWRGAAGGIVPRGIEQMIEEGSNPKTMKAFISPCICQKNFEVGEEVAEQFPDGFVDYENYRKPHVDLKGFLNYQLVEGDIPVSNIEVAEGCTIDDEEKFYSYRREGDKSGRMMGIICLEENSN